MQLKEHFKAKQMVRKKTPVKYIDRKKEKQHEHYHNYTIYHDLEFVQINLVFLFIVFVFLVC